MSGEATIPARYIALLTDWLASVGVNVPRLLADTGVDKGQLYRADGALTIRQMDAFLHAASDATGRSDLGFTLGRLVKISSHDILGYAILSSPTLDYALRLASRFYRLITPTFRMDYRRTPEQAELLFTPNMPLTPETLRFFIECVSVSAHEQIKSMLGREMPVYDLLFSYPEPAYHQRYRELVPARVHFEALPLPGARLVMRAEMLDQPLPMADRSALQMAEARCEALLQHVLQTGALSEWVTMMMREAHDTLPTLDDLAHILHTTPRTLDRRLRKEGHQFMEMSKRVRNEKARALLSAGKLSVTQVALQLGYRDVANFTRAFKRDSGMSPSEFVAASRR